MTPSAPSTPADVIDYALDTLESRGWSSGRGIGPNGEVCVLVALNMAYTDCRVNSFSQVHDAMRRVTNVIRQDGCPDPDGDFLGRPSPPTSLIPYWNDCHARDFADVRDVLKRARDLPDERPAP